MFEELQLYEACQGMDYFQFPVQCISRNWGILFRGLPHYVLYYTIVIALRLCGCPRVEDIVSEDNAGCEVFELHLPSLSFFQTKYDLQNRWTKIHLKLFDFEI